MTEDREMLYRKAERERHEKALATMDCLLEGFRPMAELSSLDITPERIGLALSSAATSVRAVLTGLREEAVREFEGDRR